MKTALSLFSANSLSTQGQFSAHENAIVANGFTSQAGNTYFNALRTAGGIIIKEDVGIGYKYRFLNGIKIYSIKDKALLADRVFHCHIYDKQDVMEQSESMLFHFLKQAANEDNIEIDRDDAQRKISEIVKEAYVTDQLSAFNSNINKKLNGRND